MREEEGEEKEERESHDIFGWAKVGTQIQSATC